MRGTVLIADDTDVSRLVLSAILRGDGLTVLEAKDGGEALRIARERAPDLLLLDVMMPVKDGFEVLAALREAKSDVPVIFLTSKGDASDRVRGLESGAADYVTKPFDAREVLARVHTQLRLRQLTSTLAEANRELRARQSALDEDLRAAAAIQRALLPPRQLRVPGVDAQPFFLPTRHVGGDLFNLHQLDDRYAIAWVLDVSGHGVGAAMVTVSVAQKLAPHSGLVVAEGVPSEPRHVLAALDREYPIERFDRFFTITYLLIDLRTGVIQYASAGHPPPLLLLRKDGSIRELREGGTIIGLSTRDFEQGTARLAEGDRVVLYTDGVVDYQGTAEEPFGLERFQTTVAMTRGLSLADAREILLHDLLGHGAGAAPADDVTLLMLEWQKDLELSFPSTLEEVRAAALRLRQFLRARGVSAGDADELELCFVEAANNAVLHAGGSDVLLRCAVADDEVALMIRDGGAPIPKGAFGPNDVPVAAEGGRGGLLLHSLADHVEVRSDATGNTILLTKLRRG